MKLFKYTILKPTAFGKIGFFNDSIIFISEDYQKPGGSFYWVDIYDENGKYVCTIENDKKSELEKNEYIINSLYI